MTHGSFEAPGCRPGASLFHPNFSIGDRLDFLRHSEAIVRSHAERGDQEIAAPSCRLDEPRRIIPWRSCFPAELASASPGALRLETAQSRSGLLRDQTQHFFYS